MQETWVWSLGWEDSPGERKGYLLQHSGLGNSRDYSAWGHAESDTIESLPLKEWETLFKKPAFMMAPCFLQFSRPQCIQSVAGFLPLFLSLSIPEVPDVVASEHSLTRPLWYSMFSSLCSFFALVFIYLVVLDLGACGIFSCSMWDLTPWRVIEPRLLALGVGSLSYWTTRKSLIFLFFNLLLFPSFPLFSIHMASFLYADSSQIYTSSPCEPQALDSASYLASPLGWEGVGLLYTHPPEKPTDAPRLDTHSLMPQPPITTSCRFYLLISFKSASVLSPLFPLHCPHFHSISPKSL